ncbi:MAG: type IV pilin N-terminal domain-containing protein [Methanogenium sp.]|nr:type IV pilin N-terminal domain-containing protein [Methanogenium sp.]
MRFTEREEAVSPVIGVILMVAITVILAAVIGAFVFGMAGDVQTTKTVAVTASVNGTGGLEITEQGGQDFNSLDSISVKINGTAEGSDSSPAIGNIIKVNTAIVTGDAHIIVVGTFDDGSSQVLLDKNM